MVEGGGVVTMIKSRYGVVIDKVWLSVLVVVVVAVVPVVVVVVLARVLIVVLGVWKISCRYR